MLVIERKADNRKRAGVVDVGEIRKGKQRTTQRSNRPAICGEGENCPRKAPRGSKGQSGAFKVGDRSLYNWFLWSITECQECDCRVIGVRCNGGSIDDAIPSIPSAAGAGVIHKHLDCTIYPRES